MSEMERSISGRLVKLDEMGPSTELLSSSGKLVISASTAPTCPDYLYGPIRQFSNWIRFSTICTSADGIWMATCSGSLHHHHLFLIYQLVILVASTTPVGYLRIEI